jgi:GTPase SAR1 family protein
VKEFNTTVEFFIVDVGGQSMYSTLRKTFVCYFFVFDVFFSLSSFLQLSNLSAVLYVYDVTDEDSFLSLQSWYKEIEELNGRTLPGMFFLLSLSFYVFHPPPLSYSLLS